MSPTLTFADAVQQSEPTAPSDVSGDADEAETNDILDRVWANYYAVYYGSSITNPSRYQSGPYDQKDTTRPIFMKNFLTVGYNLGDNFALAATGYFTFVPGSDQQFNLRDPSLRIADNSILNANGFNWYGDARVHFPVSTTSRMDDMLAGVQTFHFFSYHAPESRLTAGLYASIRYNHFGGYGVGNDVELYAAPAATYDLNSRLALTAMYEMGANHGFGDDPGVLSNDGTAFEPGILWRITNNLEFNPYLNIYTGGRIGLGNTALGATLSWTML